MDKITIKSARFLCSIGVTAEERIKKQEIIVDVEMFLSIKRSANTDNIKNAINYSEVYELLKNTVEKKDFNLVETLAEDTAKNILREFPVKEVLVRVKKPKALADRNVKYVSVEIKRGKDD